MTSGSGQLMTHKINLNFPQMSEGFKIFYNNETGTCPRVATSGLQQKDRIHST